MAYEHKKYYFKHNSRFNFLFVLLVFFIVIVVVVEWTAVGTVTVERQQRAFDL